MNIRRLTSAACLSLLLTAFAAPAAAAGDNRAAPPARGCSLSTLRGPYTFRFSGTVVTPPLPGIPTGPFAAVGRVVFAGNGEFMSELTQSFNGIILPATITSGGYTIDDECTGTASDSNGGAYYFVVSEKGRQITFILTNPGVVATGSAERQN